MCTDSGCRACAGAGIGWLYPLVDGAPAVGWEMAARYLVLPALLVGAQYASSAIISPPVNPDDDSAKTTKACHPALTLNPKAVPLQTPLLSNPDDASVKTTKVCPPSSPYFDPTP